MASPPKARSKVATARQGQSQAWQAWRIADGRFDPFSPVGASLVGGRWNSPGLGVIYATRSYAGAMLECLAHAGIGRMPRTHVAIEITTSASRCNVSVQATCHGADNRAMVDALVHSNGRARGVGDRAPQRHGRHAVLSNPVYASAYAYAYAY